MTTIKKYRLYCTTDQKNEYVWAEESIVPTACPTSAAHTIDTSRTTIVDTITESKVTIREESIETGGHFQAATMRIDAAKNQQTSVSRSWPYPISALAVEFISEEVHRGDTIDMIVGENTIIGAILSNVSPAANWVSQNYTLGQSVVFNTKVYTCIQDTVSSEDPSDLNYWKLGLEITVSSTVLEHTAIGFFIKLSDGSNVDDVGRVISIDSSNSKIYVELNSVNSFSLTTPTYVLQSVKVIDNYEIGVPWEHILGANKIGGSAVPSNTTVTVRYTNKSTDTDKVFIGQVEYLY